MQEEAGGVDDISVEAAQNVEESVQVVPAEDEKPKRKSGSRKKSKIPTVDAIVEAESSVEERLDESPEESVSQKSETVDSGDESDEALEQEEQEKLQVRRSEMNMDSEVALLETVLFLESEPQTPENLSKITQLDLDTVNQCVDLLKEKYSNADSGIELSQIVGGWILTPKKESFDLVKERYGKKNEGRLSKAAIETLSIIAYSQPITRAEIESIRHVSADNMMRILMDRKFIKEVGKKDIPGKPVMYGTTKEFLEFFHLQSIADLPQLDEKESERFELAR